MDAINKSRILVIVQQAQEIVASKGLAIVGIAGPPAAGKSTLAQNACDELNRIGVLTQNCPMDGFHFSNDTLDKIGLSAFKGRIDTFDIDHFISSLSKIRQNQANFYWPIYSRDIHDVIGKGIHLKNNTQVFIVEGNYLLSSEGRWESVRCFFDTTFYIDAANTDIYQRLLERHIRGGKTRLEAEEKIKDTDLPNVDSIRKTKFRASCVI